MGKLDKTKTAVKQNKKFIKWIIVLWIITSIVLVAPVAYSVYRLGEENGNIIEILVEEITSFTSFFRMLVHPKAIIEFLKWFAIYSVGVLYWSYKGYSSMSIKGKYYDIEHGSSDWCKDGEQYKILSKDSGIILARENYLPLDKKGNINTLIVRRFWCR